MSPKQTLAICVALTLAAGTALAQDKGKESIAGKAAASTKAAKPAQKAAAQPAATALKTAPPAAVSKPATADAALGGHGTEATQSHCHHSGGNDA
jgi:hypothetical protein